MVVIVEKVVHRIEVEADSPEQAEDEASTHIFGDHEVESVEPLSDSLSEEI